MINGFGGKLRNYLQYLGLFLILLGVSSSAAAACASFFNEQDAVLFFSRMGILQVSIGFISRRMKTSDSPNRRFAINSIVVSFLLILPLGALPYIFLEKASFVNSLFESTSGFTTCGMTVFLDVEAFHNSVLFWRSISEWLGGVFITIFLIFLSGEQLDIFARTWGLERNTGLSIPKLTKRMFMLYFGFTIMGFLFLTILGGMNTFDATNHAMTAISTGGFSTKNAGVAYFKEGNGFNPVIVESILTSLSLLGMTSFVLMIGFFLKQKPEEKTSNYKLDIQELKIMIPGILIGSILLIVLFIIELNLSFFSSLRMAIFHVVTAMSGTGYNAMNVSTWTFTIKLVLFSISIMGGSAWSGAGALKLTRVYSLLKVIPRFLVGKTRTSEIEEKTKEALSYISIYLIIIVVGFFLMYPFLSAYSLSDIFFQVGGALGNTGPQILDISQIHCFGKLSLMLLMILGYLEIWPIINLARQLISRDYQ